MSVRSAKRKASTKAPVTRHPSLVTRPVVVVEDDPFPRLIQLILDPQTPAARVAAFNHFFAHEEPDLADWCARLRKRLKRLHPAEVRLVADQQALLEREGIAKFTAGIEEIPGLRVWTDDFNNLFQILK